MDKDGNYISNRAHIYLPVLFAFTIGCCIMFLVGDFKAELNKVFLYIYFGINMTYIVLVNIENFSIRISKFWFILIFSILLLLSNIAMIILYYR